MLRSALKVLARDDVEEALALCDQDPVANLFVAARLRALKGDPRRHGGEIWGWYEGGAMRAACWSGANLVPVNANEQAVEAFAYRARRSGRQCSSIVGPAHMVLGLWQHLQASWGPARDIRANQPLMAMSTPPTVESDPLVRRSQMSELELLVPACVAMFTEEVGYSPVAADGGAVYRAQVSGLVASGRSFVRMDETEAGPVVVFKAELGSVVPEAVQVQGVWVNPRYRGQGVAAPAMAALVETVQREVAPVVSLYVNGYNTRAIRAYERVGFQTVGTYATILF
ncbi:GNAT family N-acetyltransferase [Kineosporia sp. J2-2]|uniref:GNAT family N-acetyltransferase n=1 Tax=Kineosporia corallincola TaxID=2835133 RepID=A0ABS5TT15_9ACTN|nr:GNAT family N-acetyltransferase [Kineosporia corallincola]MBT0773923.1 GNAT family N-acetyltransferase [Kineosporia corallincola]